MRTNIYMLKIPLSHTCLAIVHTAMSHRGTVVGDGGRVSARSRRTPRLPRHNDWLASRGLRSRHSIPSHTRTHPLRPIRLVEAIDAPFELQDSDARASNEELTRQPPAQLCALVTATRLETSSQRGDRVEDVRCDVVSTLLLQRCLLERDLLLHAVADVREIKLRVQEIDGQLGG